MKIIKNTQIKDEQRRRDRRRGGSIKRCGEGEKGGKVKAKMETNNK